MQTFIIDKPTGHARTEEAMLAAMHEPEVIDRLRREAQQIMQSHDTHKSLKSTALRFVRQWGMK